MSVKVARAAGRGAQLAAVRMPPTSLRSKPSTSAVEIEQSNITKLDHVNDTSSQGRGRHLSPSIRGRSDEQLKNDAIHVRARLPPRAVTTDRGSFAASVLDSRSSPRKPNAQNKLKPRHPQDDDLSFIKHDPPSEYDRNSSNFRSNFRHRPRTGHASSPEESEDRASRPFGNRSSRRPFDGTIRSKNRDWFSSESRIRAMKRASTTNSVTTNVATLHNPGQEYILFAGGNFAEVDASLPPQHWATLYVHGITSALQNNPNIPSIDKKRILVETVHHLEEYSHLELGADISRSNPLDDLDDELRFEDSPDEVSCSVTA